MEWRKKYLLLFCVFTCIPYCYPFFFCPQWIWSALNVPRRLNWKSGWKPSRRSVRGRRKRKRQRRKPIAASVSPSRGATRSQSLSTHWNDRCLTMTAVKGKVSWQNFAFGVHEKYTHMYTHIQCWGCAWKTLTCTHTLEHQGPGRKTHMHACMHTLVCLLRLAPTCAYVYTWTFAMSQLTGWWRF